MKMLRTVGDVVDTLVCFYGDIIAGKKFVIIYLLHAIRVLIFGWFQNVRFGCL
jgi:hypothetical protein